MTERIYQIIVRLSRRWGVWVFYVYAWVVASGFFLFFPGRVAVGVRFYRALFPEEPFTRRFVRTWRQFHRFTTVFVDRFLLQEYGQIAYTSEGWEEIEKALEAGTGGIILMSHLGNWEVAAHLFKRKRADFPLMLFMGEKHREQLERLQKKSLSESGVRILAAPPDGGSPFDIIEGIQFLKNGGFVSLTGDVIWHQRQRTVQADFLGRNILLPETPHLMALLSGVPVYLFFAFRTGHAVYHFSLSPPVYLPYTDRRRRGAAIQASARKYADTLAEKARRYPEQWYHFEPFIGGEAAAEQFRAPG